MGFVFVAMRYILVFVNVFVHRVSRSEDCKMPVSNLAKVLGPTIIGYSSADPTPMQMITETKKQANVSIVSFPFASNIPTSFCCLWDEQSSVQRTKTYLTSEVYHGS